MHLVFDIHEFAEYKTDLKYLLDKRGADVPLAEDKKGAQTDLLSLFSASGICPPLDKFDLRISNIKGEVNG